MQVRILQLGQRVISHLTRVDDLQAYNEEYARYFPNNKPARTTVTVAALNAPEL